MTPVESRGTATIMAAMIVCAVNAVAMGQRLRLRDAGEDSSKVSPNIFFSPPMKTLTPESGVDVPRFRKNKKAAGEGGPRVSQEQLRFLRCRRWCCRARRRGSRTRGSCGGCRLSGRSCAGGVLRVVCVHQFLGDYGALHGP